ncbi:uncharacterized protein F4807DRAFT_426835 [Annulohypoxylon truncatum]|uniref:uncharacterized protein n=1 Tax=Annulohypoxylon truncatum TaxID=327061 RepID=UPI002008C975|nr:uncharacterized protein F4807DRAFT_426835 [Annulohypoxylon truncatum]KAI1209479.1 hypothetical protein F4807DRAFT_426835 [Annulohypoxylon truncatum]
MATADTVELGPPHAPKEESLKAFSEVEHELKKQLLHMKHTYLKHEPEYFAAVQHLSDADLTSFTSADLEAVRVGMSAYGLHLFGKVRIPAVPDSGPAYIHVRLFVGGDGHDEPGVAKLHSIHTEDVEEPDGGHKYRAIFTKDDPLEWFDT